jgi:hypothetical protein
MLEADPDLTFPGWMAPPKEAILQGSLSLAHWAGPVAFLALTTLLTVTAGLTMTYVLREELMRNEKMVWPNAAAQASLVDACVEGGGSARLVGLAAFIGFGVTLLQNIPSIWGIDLTTLDLTPLLPRGALFAVSLSLGFAALGYMISYKTSLSLMVAGLITNLLVAPYLVSIGFIEYLPDTMKAYNELLFRFSIGPALGFLLLGGILLSVFILLKNRFSKEPNGEGNGSLGYLSLFRALIKGLLRDRRALAILGGIVLTLFGLVWILNPFSPLPRAVSMLIAGYILLVGSFIEFVLIAKMSGETGMSMGTAAIFLYDVPLFTAGYRGYTGFYSYPYFRPSPWISGVVSYAKYEDQFRLSWRDIVKLKFLGWIPCVLFSVGFTLVLWKYVGFGTPLMPAVSLIQSKVYLTMIATGDFVSSTSGIFPAAFVIGGVVGALLEVFTPISMMGLGMGMLLPPHYIIPFGVGGLVRLMTDRRWGEEFYREKGRLIVTGLMASSLIVQVLMTVLLNFF